MKPIRTDQLFIGKLTEIVLENIGNENFGVEDLARVTGTSRITIYRRLRSIRNQGVSQFIKEIRLRRALELLEQNINTVSEVAFMVGFSSPAYFNKCFHDFFGFSPGKVKHEVAKSLEEIIPAEIIETKGQKRSLKRTFNILTLALISLISLVFIGYLLFTWKFSLGRSVNTIGSMKSIAILPFRNLSDSIPNQYFIDGIQEDVLSNLCKLHGLRVQSLSSTSQYRDRKKQLSEIAHDLNVRYLVEGSGQKLGDKLILRVGLYDSEDCKELWAKSYSRQILRTSDLAFLQSEIARSIAAELETAITPEEDQLIDKETTRNLTALDFYQQAHEVLGNFPYHDLVVYSNIYPIFFDEPFNHSQIQKARLLYKAALDHDSSFAAVYTELAALFWSEHYSKDYYSANYLDSVLLLANKAISIDPLFSDGYFMRAMYFSERGKIKEARQDFDRALELNPNNWLAFYGKGITYLEIVPDADYMVAIDNFLKAASRTHGAALPYILRRIGYVLSITNFKELARKYYLDASLLAMDSTIYFQLECENNLLNGDTVAFTFLKKAYMLDSTDVRIIWNQAFYLYLNGQFSRSLMLYKKYRNILQENGINMMNDLHQMAVVYKALGMNDSADYYYTRQIENCNASIKLGRPFGISYAYLELALVYAMKGDKENSMKNLSLFMKRKGLCNWFFMAESPAFLKFKDDPEYKSIIRDMHSMFNKEQVQMKKKLEERGMI